MYGMYRSYYIHAATCIVIFLFFFRTIKIKMSEKHCRIQSSKVGSNNGISIYEGGDYILIFIMHTDPDVLAIELLIFQTFTFMVWR